MRRAIDLILRILAAISLPLIPVAFVLSGSVLTPALEATLRIEVDPRFSGGSVLARFHDPAGDDHGEGGLTYPKARTGQEKGELDLITYTVFEPVTDAPWSADRAFWQLGVTLSAFGNTGEAPNGFPLASIRIYVDTDGTATGSLQTAAARAELVCFDPSAPWDICVTLDGWHDTALLRTADGKTSRRIPLVALREQRCVYVRLPLDLPEVRRVLDGRPTRHYVVVCGYDPFAADNVLQVSARPAQNQGGGARSSLTPRVFDVLAVEPGRQEEMLSTYDETKFRYAVLEPAVCRLGEEDTGPAVDLESLQADAEAEAQSERSESDWRLRLEAESDDPIVAGAALFGLGRGKDAEAKLRESLARDPDNAAALAYLGSLRAMQGGECGSPAEAVRLVQQAFELLDRAESAAKTPADRQTVLRNRAAVASAVPEEVFAMNAAAARDYLELADMAESCGDPRLASDHLVSAGLVLERVGSASSADLAFARALAQGEHTARARFELARRGYPVPAAEATGGEAVP